MSTTHNTIEFADIAIPDFVDIILRDKEKADEAAYYLLSHRCNQQLRQRYEVVHRELFDDFEDIVEDFFLYLREGKNGRNRFPYQALQRIKKTAAFETWLLNTFRNFLTMRVESEHHLYMVSLPSDERAPIPDESVSILTDERKLSVASSLIAYAHQMFYPRGRFIFLRTLLTILNKQKALPDKEIAQALGMTHLAYRVSAHRMKANLHKFRQRLLLGERLRLDSDHQRMAQQISEDFIHLYHTLLGYYTGTIDTLKCADAIKALRQQYYENTGMMLHEPTPDYIPAHTTITAFWNKLNRLLFQYA